MPAVTVEDVGALDRVDPVDRAGTNARPVLSITDAPSGFEGEGFPVRRAFAGVEQRRLDPFVHMDQMGEVEYAPGEPKGTPWHPHRGFETVTYMIDGTFQHQDSIGGGGLITNGDTQWMTAGGGILHIEAPPEELVATGGLFHGIQLWVNLPKADKMIAPRYQDIGSSQVALLSSPDGGTLFRVIAGDLAGHVGPGSTHSPMAMIHATLSPGAKADIPWNPQFNALVYVLGGNGTVGAGWSSDPHRTAGGVRGGRVPDPRSRRRTGVADPESRCADPRWPAHPRAGLRLRAVRDEHQGRGGPGVRGLPGRTAGHRSGRPHLGMAAGPIRPVRPCAVWE